MNKLLQKGDIMTIQLVILFHIIILHIIFKILFFITYQSIKGIAPQHTYIQHLVIPYKPVHHLHTVSCLWFSLPD